MGKLYWPLMIVLIAFLVSIGVPNIGMSEALSDTCDSKVEYIMKSATNVYNDFIAKAECVPMASICYVQDESTNVHYYFVVTGSYEVHVSKQIVYNDRIEVIAEGIRWNPDTRAWNHFTEYYKVVHTKDAGDKIVYLEGAVNIWDEVVEHLFGK
jgi:hypothetical protein